MPAVRFRLARAMRSLAALGLGVAFASLAAPRAFAQGAWTGDFSIPSFDGATRACAILGGEYVVAGDFQWAGGTRASNVARWTGAAWEQLGFGLRGQVHRLAVWNSTLLAATEADNADAPVMHYDGTDWNPLGANLYGDAEALHVAGNDVYAGGMFSLSGQTTGYRVVRWGGGAWEPVGGTFDGRVLAIAVWNGALYAAGEFLSGDIGYVSRIARFDGTHWVSVAGGLNAGTPYIASLAVFQDRLVAGGYFESVGNVPARGIAAWDGNVWSALPETPNDCIVRDLEVDGGQLIVAGVLQVPNLYASGLIRFDGQAWYLEDTHPNWSVDDVAAGNGAVLAVGGFSSLDTGTAPNTSTTMVRNVVVRDPAWRTLEAWQPTMRGLRGPSWTAVTDLHVHGGELFAGGYFSQVADPPHWREAESIARWDGIRWQPVAGNLRGWVQEIGSWKGELVVAGQLAAGEPGESATIVAWNGSQWRKLEPIAGNVTSLVTWQDALVATGGLTFENALPGDDSSVMVYDGQNWRVLGGSLEGSNTQVSAAAVFGGDLYVGGQNLLVPGEGVFPVVRWDGTKWTGVPGIVLSHAQTMRTLQDALWVGGYSWYRLDAGALWSWNGIEWTDRGLAGWSVRDVESVDGRPIAAGSGPLTNGLETLARFANGDWASFPDPPDRPVAAIASLDRDLYVGGWFTRAGGRAAEAVARFSFGAVPPGPRAPVALSAGPNPAASRVNFRFTLTRPGRVRLAIHDLAGALVASPIDETFDAGTIERSWFPRSGGVFRSGIFFAKLTTPEGEAKTRIVVMR